MILVRISADRSRKTPERVSIVEKLLAAISNFAHIAEGSYEANRFQFSGVSFANIGLRTEVGRA